MAEPPLVLRAPYWRRPWYLARIVPAALLAVVLIVVLLVTGNLTLPFRPVVVLHGAGGSTAELLADDQVGAALLRRDLRVQIARTGSRDSSRLDPAGLDFVLPSGQPATDVLVARQDAAHRAVRYRRLVNSRVVLASFRAYAETLVRAGVARPQEGGDRPTYYDIDMARFAGLLRDGRRWRDLGIESSGRRNDGPVVAVTSSVCDANSAASYLALLADAVQGGPVTTPGEADATAAIVGPLVLAQGAPVPDPGEVYFGSGGDGAPIVVVYEHQFLAHQLRSSAATGHLDDDRVLLYPTRALRSDTNLVALDDAGASLLDALTTDEVRDRALELGYRTDADDAVSGAGSPLGDYLAAHHVPVPTRIRHDGGAPTVDETTVALPSTDLLERMITTVGRCP